jgi:hypothetical protein
VGVGVFGGGKRMGVGVFDGKRVGGGVIGRGKRTGVGVFDGGKGAAV